MDDKLCVDNYEYQQLLSVRAKYDILVCTLFNNAELTYRKDDISFNSNAVRDVMFAIENNMYKKKIKELKAEEENKNATTSE